jgi:hypothetical protein
MNFSQALDECKSGKRISRSGWNGKGMWLRFVPTESWHCVSKLDAPENLRLLPWIGMKTADGGFVPWLASQTDILADDWGVVV